MLLLRQAHRSEDLPMQPIVVLIQQSLVDQGIGIVVVLQQLLELHEALILTLLHLHRLGFLLPLRLM
jgi:hypothetical protein